MTASICICPFALFGNPGTQRGAELVADAMREMLADNRREKRPTRARAYQGHVKLKELPLATPADYADWQGRARWAVKQALDAGDFLIWVGGNHLSVMPVYEELGARPGGLVVQFDAHLDVYNLTDNPPELNHGNFLRHVADPRPAVANLGHRDLFLPDDEIKQFFRLAVPVSELIDDPAAVEKSLRLLVRPAKRIFIDIDCDVLDPAFFPAEDDPLPFGLTPPQLLRWINAVWSERVVGVAFSEFDPGRDRNDQSLAVLVWLIEYVLLKRFESSRQ